MDWCFPGSIRYTFSTWLSPLRWSRYRDAFGRCFGANACSGSGTRCSSGVSWSPKRHTVEWHCDLGTWLEASVERGTGQPLSPQLRASSRCQTTSGVDDGCTSRIRGLDELVVFFFLSDLQGKERGSILSKFYTCSYCDILGYLGLHQWMVWSLLLPPSHGFCKCPCGVCHYRSLWLGYSWIHQILHTIRLNFVA